MADRTAIEWCDATINWWIGCTEISAACDHCYARDLAARYGWASWGQGQPRTLTKSARATAYKLERRAVREGRRLKVFTNSLSDFMDAEVPDSYRDDAFVVIDDTPHLDWLILTKRPQVARQYLSGKPVRPNVWLGTTAETQKMADLRIPLLLQTPAAKRFISAEPLLGPLDLYNGDPDPRLGGHRATKTFIGDWWEPGDNPKGPSRHGVDWVIVGGESGPNARPFDLAWARSLVEQCRAAEVACFVKQMGHQPVDSSLVAEGDAPAVGFRDKKGGDWSEWPSDLRVREFPA